MTVELISVGTEILMGNIVNSNTQFLAENAPCLVSICFSRSRWGIIMTG